MDTSLSVLMNRLFPSKNGLLLDFINIHTIKNSKEIESILWHVIDAVGIEMKKDNLQRQNITINCFFRKKDIFDTINPIINNAYASASRVVYYPIKTIRPLVGNWILYAIFAEELCHLIWDISDETVVKFKVLSIMRNTLGENITIGDLYNDRDDHELRQLVQDYSLKLTDFRNAVSYTLPEV